MSLPNPIIVSAFFESYISIRKATWHLDINQTNSIQNPKDETALHKLGTSVDMLAKFKAAETFEDWLSIVDELHEKQLIEDQIQNNRNFIARKLTNTPLLSAVLSATRTYILSEIKSEDKFKQLQLELNRQRETFEERIAWQEKYQKRENITDEAIKKNKEELAKINNTLAARKENDKDYLDFFENKILTLDPLATKLDEKSFEDFKKNVLDNSRPLSICGRLLPDQHTKPVTNEVAKENPRRTSTPTQIANITTTDNSTSLINQQLSVSPETKPVEIVTAEVIETAEITPTKEEKTPKSIKEEEPKSISFEVLQKAPISSSKNYNNTSSYLTPSSLYQSNTDKKPRRSAADTDYQPTSTYQSTSSRRRRNNNNYS